KTCRMGSGSPRAAAAVEVLRWTSCQTQCARLSVGYSRRRWTKYLRETRRSRWVVDFEPELLLPETRFALAKTGGSHAFFKSSKLVFYCSKIDHLSLVIAAFRLAGRAGVQRVELTTKLAPHLQTVAIFLTLPIISGTDRILQSIFDRCRGSAV